VSIVRQSSPNPSKSKCIQVQVHPSPSKSIQAQVQVQVQATVCDAPCAMCVSTTVLPIVLSITQVGRSIPSRTFAWVCRRVTIPRSSAHCRRLANIWATIMSPRAGPVGRWVGVCGQGPAGKVLVHQRDSSGVYGKNFVITSNHTTLRTGMSMNTALQNVRANAERVLPCAEERWLCQFPAATSA
jgi:hypothetical protein